MMFCFESNDFIKKRTFMYSVVVGNNIIYIDSFGATHNLFLGSGGEYENHIVKNLDADIVAVSGGFGHYLALKNNGTVWAWGQNKYLQCGILGVENVDEPICVTDLNNVTMISCGTFHSAALKKDGTVWRWGTIDRTGTGWPVDDAVMPTQIHGLENIIWLSCGQEYILAIDQYGCLWGMGSNYSGQLGIQTQRYVDSPIKVMEIPNAIGIYNDLNNIYVLKKSGSVSAWGFDKQRGYQPLELTKRLRNMIAMSVSKSCCFAYTQSGELYSWGDDFDAALMHGTIHYPANGYTCTYPQIVRDAPKSIVGIGASSSLAVVLDTMNDLFACGAGCGISTCTPIKMGERKNMTAASTPIPERTAYTVCALAYLDILGFKNLVLENRRLGHHSNSLLIKTKMDLLAQLNKIFCKMDVTITLMSDSIIVTIPIAIPHAIQKFLYVISEINGMLNGSVLRGAISIDEVYHKENILFGPALITAYQLEEHKASVPRIIIDKDVLSLLAQTEPSALLYFIQESDYCFFDFLSYVRNTNEIGTAYDSVLYAISLNYFNGDFIDSTGKIAPKYDWLLKYIYQWSMRNLPCVQQKSQFFVKPLQFKTELPSIITTGKTITSRKVLALSVEGAVLVLHDGDIPQIDIKTVSLSQFILEFNNNFNISPRYSQINSSGILPPASIRIYSNSGENVFEITLYYVCCVNADSLTEDAQKKYYWRNIELLLEYERTNVENIRNIMRDNGEIC